MRVIKVLVNWFIVLVPVPILGGLFIVAAILFDAVMARKEKKSTFPLRVLKGEEWFYE